MSAETVKALLLQMWLVIISAMLYNSLGLAAGLIAAAISIVFALVVQ